MRLLATALDSGSRLPVMIVTGFLGSGKTTLLNHILASRHGLRIAVIVNEIGEIGIDGELIVAADDTMLELSNGCVCCSLNNDLFEAIFRILERQPQLDYLVVESTGLADPLPIILTFLRSEFRDRIRLDSIIAIADAANLSLDLFDSKAARNQLRYADIVLLNKCDLASGAQLDDIEAKIRNTRTDARIIHTTRAAVPLRLILDIGLARGFQYASIDDGEGGRTCHDHPHLAEDGFVTVSFASDRPFAVDKFQQFLNEQLPRELFRGKGILWIAESDRQFIFHLVGNRFSLDQPNSTPSKSNRLVLIGRNLEGEQLLGQLKACLA
jgi:G3E family GTPase